MPAKPGKHAQAPDATSGQLIGEALIKEGALTPKQLERALRIQARLEQARPLGEILVELGYVTKQAVTDAISKHGAGMRIGEILVEQGHVTPEQLAQARGIQKETGGQIGKILIDLGLINDRILVRCLAQQNGLPYIEPNFAMLNPALLNSVSPEFLERFNLLPFSQSEDGSVTVVVADPNDENCLQAIRELYIDRYALALGPPDAIRQAIADFRLHRQQAAADHAKPETAGGDESVVQLVDHILRTAIENRASDIHIEPMSNVVRLRYRIDGVLVYKTDLPKDLLPKIASRFKILADVNIAESRRHQGGRLLYRLGGAEYDMRVSIYVTVHGECIVLRVLNKQTGLIDLGDLGMAPAMLERYRHEVLETPTGVVLITGPTGSGKTTTLYSSLKYNNNIEVKIITAEDPVEYQIDGLIQCSVYDKIGRTFESTLREIVRQDPDIIVLGEIRDRTTAEVAIQAALTGHKVYSTFHTEDSIGALLRLIDMDIETFLIASTVIAVVAQRLLRRICPDCALSYTPPAFELDRLGLKPEDARQHELRKGHGCKRCNFTGYFGRIAVYELLILNEDVKEAILQKQSAHAIRRIALESTGLISMREDAIAKVIRGQTTLDEVARNTPRTFGVRRLRQILAMTK